jgi:hypothetical protein
METTTPVYLALLAGLCLVVAGGCARKNPDEPVQMAAMEDAIVDAAANSPAHSPKWDALVRDLSHRYVLGAGRYHPDPALTTLSRQAIDQGCREPFVRYLWFWHEVSTTSAPSAEMSREGIAVMDDMHGQSYPAFLQTFAAMRSIEMFRRDTLWTETTDASKAEYNRLFSLLEHEAMDALESPGLTERESRVIAGAFEAFWEDPRYGREVIFRQVEKAVANRYGDCATVHLLRGNEAILRAWDARGSDYADQVTEEGRRIFGEQLRVARKELTRAWALDPSEPMIAEKMITVCMGLSLPREEMETWFQRGQSAHAYYPSLCRAKSLYLSPIWLGTLDEQLAFSRECLAHPEYGSEPALTLWRAHKSYQSINDLPLAYFAQPRVWDDIKRSFDAYFEREPDMVFMRMHYAYHAWLARDWRTLSRQLALADPAVTDLRKFVPAPMLSDDDGVRMDRAREANLEAQQMAAGRAIYDQMLSDSKAHPTGN